MEYMTATEILNRMLEYSRRRDVRPSPAVEVMTERAWKILCQAPFNMILSANQLPIELFPYWGA